MTEFNELKEKPGACLHCGNSPVNHTATYIFNSMNVFLGELFFAYARSSLARTISRVFAYVQLYTIGYFNGFSKLLGIIRYTTDQTKAATYQEHYIVLLYQPCRPFSQRLHRKYFPRQYQNLFLAIVRINTVTSQ